MKQFLSTVRMALYMVAIPLTITAAASAHQWFGAPTPTAKKLTHVVELSENGMVRGRVSTLAEGGYQATANAMTKLMKDGNVVATSKTGVDGYFSFDGMEPGVYTLTSANSKAFAAFSIEVVANGSSDQASSTLRVVASQNDDVIRQLLSEAKDKFTGTNSGVSRIAGASNSVHLTVSGNFEGTVNSISDSASEVVLVANGQKVKEAKTDSEGHFVLRDVEPGNYSFVAINENGYAVTAVQLIEAAPVYTSTNAQEEELFEVTVAQELPGDEDEYEVVEETTIIEEVPVAGPPMGGYGYGGGGYGPYGGGGGIGGFNLSGVGDLIGLGIGAWVLTEVIDQIDDDNNIPTPVPVPNPPTPISGYTYIYL